MLVAERELYLLELTICNNSPTGFSEARRRKDVKYAPLVLDLEDKGFTVVYITLEIGSLGHFTREAVRSYRTHATSEPGRVAALAEDRKVDKYRDLPRSHLFCPLSIETMGAMGPRSLELVREVGRRIALETGEPRSTDFLGRTVRQY